MNHNDDSWFKYKVEIRPAEWEKKNCRWKISKIFSNFFQLKIEILMMRNFWMKKNAKKFNKCETM